jgi:hypothetical protein
MASIQTHPPHIYWHIGEVLWSMYYGTHYDPCRDVRIWEDQEGSIRGFAWFEEPNSVELQVDPRLRGSGLLEAPMLVWAAEHAGAFQPSDDRKLETSVLDHDSEMKSLLVSLGFNRGEASIVSFLRSSMARFRPHLCQRVGRYAMSKLSTNGRRGSSSTVKSGTHPASPSKPTAGCARRLVISPS